MSKKTALALALSLGLSGSFLAPAHAESEDRPLPDYDGREQPTTPGDVLIWVPRVILFPVYLVTEYVVRKPLGFLIAGAERAGLPAWLYDFFTFDDHRAGIVPTAYVDFDFYPSIGFFFFYNEVFIKNHDLRLRAAFGGGEWLAASFASRFHLSSDPYDVLAFEASGERRPDYTYFGLGPDTRQSDLVRYGQDQLEARAIFNRRLWRASSFRAQLTLRSMDFVRGGYGDEPVLEDEVANGELPEPPGYVEGYSLLRSEVSAALDTRQSPPAPGSGFRVQAQVAHSALLRDPGSFVHYGGTVGGFLDLNQHNRVVSLGLTTRFVDPIGDAVVPFTELVTLGGPEPMHGLYPGRLYDRSAAVLSLGYRWPIWIWLDGAIRLEAGNVFGEHLAGFRVERLRWSGALGVESVSTPDSAFQFLLGVASETFESGGKVDSFRLAIGTTSGF
jgi:hypothetical protein